MTEETSEETSEGTSEGKSEIKVAIVGAGMAGLTAALRLSQLGCKVTVYEERSFIGGCVGASELNGIYYDVNPHLFGNWYNNFWAIVEGDLGIKREEGFAPSTNVKFLRKGEFPRFTQITNPGSLQTTLTNLLSGVESVPDMFVFAYSLLDLLTQTFEQDEISSRYSVEGFLSSRFYATNGSADLIDSMLMIVWCVHSYRMSARSYRQSIKYASRHPDPAFWFARGDSHTMLLKPFREKLEKLGSEIHNNVRVTQVNLYNGKVSQIQLTDTGSGEATMQPVDYLILAVPPGTIGALALSTPDHYGIDDILPQTAELRRHRFEPLGTLYLYFKNKLPGIPKEPVGLRGSRYHLSFTDISQWWSNDPNVKDVTALVVTASEFYAIPSSDPNEDAYDMIKELHGYMPSLFNVGEYWGHQDSDIDWDKSHFWNNKREELYVNLVGNLQYALEPTYQEIPNLFFAGNSCRNIIDIATVEASVVTGLNAAEALRSKVGLGGPIEIIEPDAYPESAVIAMKLLLAPYAVGAKWWSMMNDALSAGDEGWENPMRPLWGYYNTFVNDWWKAAFSAYSGVLPGR